jgi:tRNA A-37 threonylcarbamoyl transferase component Bud32
VGAHETAPVSQVSATAFNVCTSCRLAMDTGEVRCTRCGGALTRSDPQLFIGESFGKYELQEVIGSGGMGVVLKARHRTLDHHVAIKLLRPGVVDAQLRERFLREARLLAGLHHPNIVLIHDFDVSEWGVPYYVMEHLQGHSLASEIASNPQGLEWERTCTILHGVVDALAFAHARGIVHRDLKPDNIFIAQANGEEQVKLLDFGIARYLEENEEGGARLTQAGFVVGTPLYFAPEQFFGYPVTLATDQFALALIVAEMLRGKPLRNGRSFSEISFEGLAHSATDMSTRLPAGMSQAATAAIGRALKVDPATRFPDVVAFARALGLDPASPAPRTAPPQDLAATRPAPQAKGARDEGAAAATRVSAPRVRAWPLVAVVVAAILTGLAWTQRGYLFPQHAGAAAGVSAASTPSTWLRARQELGVPVDARAILVRRADVVVLESADGWYLRPLDASLESSRVVLPAEQRLLGPLEDGRLALIVGDMVRAVDPVTRDATDLGRLPGGIDAKSVLRIAADGRTAVARQGDDLVLFHPGAGQASTRIAFAQQPGSLNVVALDRAYLAAAAGSHVRVYRSSDGTPVLDEALDLGDVRDLALLDAPPKLAVAGREPEIRLLALDRSEPTQTIPVQRGAHSLAWSADGPSLVVAGEGGVSVWRDRAFLPEHYASASQRRGMLLVDGGGVLVLDGEARRLASFDVGTLPIAAERKVSTLESWAVHVDGGRDTVQVGATNGTLYTVQGEQVGVHPLHADGVTALAGDADYLASASDDRTLAIWRLPDMTIQWRSRGHDFLINQIALVGSKLWSSSADGTLKSWRWPTLEEQQSLDLRALSGIKDLQLHAFWMDASFKRALVGTWNSRLLALERSENKWVAKSIPIASLGGYHLLGIPSLHLVMVEGTQPTRLYAYDLDARKLYEVPDLHNVYFTLTGDGSADSVLLAGIGVVARYRFERSADGGWRVQIAARARSELGAISAADFDPARRRLWAANTDGTLFAIDPPAFPDKPPISMALRAVDAP